MKIMVQVSHSIMLLFFYIYISTVGSVNGCEGLEDLDLMGKSAGQWTIHISLKLDIVLKTPLNRIDSKTLKLQWANNDKKNCAGYQLTFNKRSFYILIKKIRCAGKSNKGIVNKTKHI